VRQTDFIGNPNGEIVMKNNVLGLVLALVASLSTVSVVAADKATLEDAKTMASNAAQLIKEKGADAAAVAFMQKDGPFRDRDLYVVMVDRDGYCIAHGMAPALVGKNLIDLKDVDGKPMIRLSVAVTAPEWIDYKWPTPVTKQVEQKSTYVVPVDKVLVSVGAYKGQ
jgi:signal transduction histidine kinase